MAEERPRWFDLLGELEQGDRVALATLGRLVIGHLVRLRAYDIRDSWDDLCQDVVMRLWRAWRDGKIESERAFVRYAGTVTRNALIDSIERARRSGRPASGPELERSDLDRTADPGPEPHELLALRQAIERLPDKQRRIIEEIYVKGRTYADTAAVLEIPRGTINRLQREAIRQLRATFGQAGADIDRDRRRS